MNPEHWRQVHAVFSEVQRQPPPERPARLDQLCGDDAVLRNEVQELLDHDHAAESEGFLSVPCPLRAQIAPTAANGSMTGRRIGPYEIERSLGSGGMGNVYLARRVGDYRQQVALKIVKASGLSDHVLQRFLRERQVLAGLVHPNIARLLDGGTTDDGLPYLVMEYIVGEHVDRYCIANPCSTRDRIRLIHQVAVAVQYAHDQNIVHRDLKPANILVTPDGTPKLTDFGLAKHLDADDEQTIAGQLMGTPSYMAPEQAAGGVAAIGPATDVYAMGAVLYELLAGRVPLRGATTRETIELVLHQEPVPPSRLEPAIGRDLETICLKCLEKDPSRRYATAGELAADLARFLAGEPIRARPVPPAERAWRWCLRNPRVAGLLATLCLVVTSGFAAVTVLWRIAEREKVEAGRQFERAEARLTIARRAVDDMYTKVAERWLASEPGMTQLQREFLEKALTFYQELAAEETADPQLLFKTAQAYHFMARVQSQLGRSHEAVAAYQAQLDLLEKLAAEFPHERRYRFDMFHSHLALLNLANSSQREQHGQAGLEIIQKLAEDFPDDPLIEDALAHQLARVALVTSAQGDLDRAIALHELGLERARALVARFPDRTEPPNFLGNVELNLTGLGEIYLAQGRAELSERAFREALAVQEQLAALNPSEHGRQHAYAGSMVRLSDLFMHAGRLDEALELAQAALAVEQRLRTDFPDVPGYSSTVAGIQYALGQIYLLQSRPVESEQAFRTAIETEEQIVRQFPELNREFSLASFYALCPVETLRNPARAVVLARRAIERDPQNPDVRCVLGAALYRAGDWPGVIGTLGDAPRDARHGAGYYLAMAHWQQGDRETARAILDETARQLGHPAALDCMVPLLHAEATSLIDPAASK